MYKGSPQLSVLSASAWIGRPSQPVCRRHCYLVSRPLAITMVLLHYHSPSGSLSFCSARSSLSLLCFLGALRSRLLLFGLLDRLRASSRPSLWSLGTALLDHIQRSTDDSTPGLDLATAAGLGLLLNKMSEGKAVQCADTLFGSAYLRDTLSPLSSAQDGPGDAAGVLALQEQ